jgi:acetyltransferase
MFVGLQNDPVYGPAVLLGLGGVAVELGGAPVMEMAPFDGQIARSMIESLREAPLFRGYRGRPPLDTEALADFLSRASLLAWDLKDQLASMDFNPVMVGPKGDGVLAVDALLLVKST